LSGLNVLDLKTVAYFHDPPWKAWVIWGKHRLLPGGSDAIQAHEADALNLLSELGLRVDEFPPEVRVADRLAASLDRWVIGGDAGGGSTYKLVKRNIFVPEISHDFGNEVGRDPLSGVDGYVHRLGGIARNAGNLRHHALEFAAPLLWYDEFPFAVPSADTRALTHTIFDHAEATAALAPLVGCDGRRASLRGWLVQLEVQSVQELLGYSRKVRDLWAASWITSYLLWAAAQGFVERFGPDISLRPELGLNHFYISWLLGRIPGVRQELGRLANRFALYGSAPRIPMIGDKVLLLVPPDGLDDAGKVEDMASDGVRRAWNALARRTIGEPPGDGPRRKYVEAALQDPPFEVTVHALNLGDEFEAFSSKAGVDLNCEGYVDPRYAWLFTYLLRRLGRASLRHKLSYGSSSTNVVSAVEELTSSSYELCTMCGVMPAAYDCGNELHRARFDMDEHERLCPYCAVKRGTHDAFVDALNELGMHAVHEGEEIPSTTELALTDFLKWIDVRGSAKLVDSLAGCMDGSESACGQADELLRSSGRDRGLDGKAREMLAKLGSRYYAIVKGDGDWLGRVWAGYPGDGGTGAVRGLSSYAAQMGLREEDLKDLMESYYGIFGRDDRADVPVPVTPAYAYAISRALSAQAVSDVEKLKSSGALTIYVGGDDLLALAPLRLSSGGEFRFRYVPLDIVKQTRSGYWGGGIDGFATIAGAVFDSLRGYGRSYAVFVAHHRDPLPLAIRRATELLEKKDGVKGKDVLFISSGRGVGELEFAAFRLGGDSGQDVIGKTEELLRALDAEILSSNSPRDLLELEDYSRIALKDDGFAEAYRGMVRRTVRRNCSGSDEDCDRIEELLASAAALPPCEGRPCHGDLLTSAALAATHMR
jgi:CRISPR-associated protein Cmr2